jgi:hypothetical protein
MIFFNTTTVTYALAYFLPIILNTNLGFSIGASQCLIAPPYAFAGFVMYATGYLGDRYHLRGPIIIANMVLCLIGTPIMGWHPSPSVRYFGVFLVTAGANSNVPAALSYQANNIRGQWKRAFCSATFVGFGGIGGIAGSLVFRSEDAATGYKPGLYAAIACAVLNIILVLIVDTKFFFDNRAADRGEKELEHEEDVSRLIIPILGCISVIDHAYRRCASGASDIRTSSTSYVQGRTGAAGRGAMAMITHIKRSSPYIRSSQSQEPCPFEFSHDVSRLCSC